MTQEPVPAPCCLQAGVPRIREELCPETRGVRPFRSPRGLHTDLGAGIPHKGKLTVSRPRRPQSQRESCLVELDLGPPGRLVAEGMHHLGSAEAVGVVGHV